MFDAGINLGRLTLHQYGILERQRYGILGTHGAISLPERSQYVKLSLRMG